MSWPTHIIQGTLVPQLQTQSFTFDPESGAVSGFTYSGFGQQAMRNLYTEIANAGIACNLVEAGGRYTLQSNDTRNQSAIDVWIMDVNRTQIPVQKNPRFLAGGAYPISEEHLRLIGELTEGKAHQTGETLRAKLVADGATNAVTLLDEIIRGETHYASGDWVLRHTTNVAENSAFNVSDSRYEYIYSTAKLLEECTDTSLWVKPLPQRLITKIQSVDETTVREGYTWGWLKQRSPESTSANCRINITTEYWHQQWSTLRYPVYS